MSPIPRHPLSRNRRTGSLNVIPRTPLRLNPLARADVIELYVRSKFRTDNTPLMQQVAGLENVEKRRRRASSGAVGVRFAAAMRKKVLLARFSGLKKVGRNSKRMVSRRELAWSEDYEMWQDEERGLLDAFGGLSIGGWGGCGGPEAGDGEQMMVMWIGTGRW